MISGWRRTRDSGLSGNSAGDRIGDLVELMAARRKPAAEQVVGHDNIVS
jgi:hypothetical protein